MAKADLKEIQARAREMNSLMNELRMSFKDNSGASLLGELPRILASQVVAIATLSAMVEKIADHLLDLGD